MSGGSIDALESVFTGRAKPSTCKDLLQALFGQLKILAWKTDYLKAHVECLLGEAQCELSTTTPYPAEVRVSRDRHDGSPEKEETSTPNPSTPPRILEEDRSNRRHEIDVSTEPEFFVAEFRNVQIASQFSVRVAA